MGLGKKALLAVEERQWLCVFLFVLDFFFATFCLFFLFVAVMQGRDI